MVRERSAPTGVSFGGLAKRPDVRMPAVNRSQARHDRNPARPSRPSAHLMFSSSRRRLSNP